MPGYPAFLALIYAITGRTGESRSPMVMLGQATVDLLGCVFIAILAVSLVRLATIPSTPAYFQELEFSLAELCPFTANYKCGPSY